MGERSKLLSDYDGQVRYDGSNYSQLDVPGSDRPEVTIDRPRRFEITRDQIQIPTADNVSRLYMYYKILLRQSGYSCCSQIREMLNTHIYLCFSTRI